MLADAASIIFPSSCAAPRPSLARLLERRQNPLCPLHFRRRRGKHFIGKRNLPRMDSPFAFDAQRRGSPRRGNVPLLNR